MSLPTQILIFIQFLSFVIIAERYVALYRKEKGETGDLESEYRFVTRNRLMEHMDKVLLAKQDKISLRIGWLAVMGNIATMVGLVATLGGMFGAFAMSGQVSPDLKAKVLSDGIASAMGYIGYGLLVAIPALVAYSIYDNRANVLMHKINMAYLKAYVSLMEKKR